MDQQSGAFKAKELLDFGLSNDWQLVDSLTITKNDSIVINPEINTNNYSDNILIQIISNELVWNDFKIYRFKTGWIKVEPGNFRETDVTGILALKIDKTEFYVYHCWGE